MMSNGSEIVIPTREVYKNEENQVNVEHKVSQMSILSEFYREERNDHKLIANCVNDVADDSLDKGHFGNGSSASTNKCF